jgi:MFS family permease
LGPNKPGTNEKGSALFTMFGSIGSILANILGSLLFQSFGNRITSDTFGVLSLIMALIFFLANIKPAFLKKKVNPLNKEAGQSTNS